MSNASLLLTPPEQLITLPTGVTVETTSNLYTNAVWKGESIGDRYLVDVFVDLGKVDIDKVARLNLLVISVNDKTEFINENTP